MFDPFVPTKYIPITPSDTLKLPSPVFGLLAETTGTVKVGFIDGTTDTLPVIAGNILAGNFYQVFATPVPPVVHGVLA